MLLSRQNGRRIRNMKNLSILLSAVLAASASCWSSDAFAVPLRCQLTAKVSRQIGLLATCSPVQAMPFSPTQQENEDFQRSLHYLYRNFPDDPFYEVDCDFKVRAKNSRLMDQYKLTLLEGMAIFAYTHRAYADLNEMLRANEGQPVPEAETFVGHLLNGLKKIPPYIGTVYRSTILPEEVLEKLRIGGTMEAKFFLSAIRKSLSEIQKSRPGRHEFEIISDTARLVEELSLYPKEGEVLFEPGASFEVVAMDGESDGSKMTIVLKEISSP